MTRFITGLCTLLLLVCQSALALEGDTPEAEEQYEEELTETEEEAIEADTDGSLDDATSSIDVREVPDGLSLTADVRAGYFEARLTERDNEEVREDFVAARWRVRSEYGITPYLRAVGRMAGICSTIDCNPNFILQDYIPTNRGIGNGDITLDEAYFHWFRLERFDLALGRMQTKFVARGGVFAKSLDRNDSNNINVNWTDGMHFTFRGRNGWVPHFILQHNSSDGPTNVRRGPLDFSDPAARITYFFGIESLKRTPIFLQRGLDISYLPKSLLTDGDLSGRRDDYYGIVIRSSNRWPRRDDGPRLRVASELGYAPNTQTRAAAGLAGDGNVGGLAWNVAASFMEFVPDHSVGFNYGRVDAGWLLSPQFRQNEWLAEVRYQWRKSKNLAFDFRVRKRKELEQLQFADRRREEVDYFLRFTWGGKIL